MAASYSSYAAKNDEEPTPDLSSIPAASAHIMPDGTTHPVQVGEWGILGGLFQ
jgi:hypothetical protein